MSIRDSKLEPNTPTPPGAPRSGERSAERELSRVDLEAIIEALPVLLFVLDEHDRYIDYRVGGGSGLFVSPEQFLGRDVLEVLPQDTHEPIGGAIARVRKMGQETTAEYTLPMSTGLETYEARMVPLGGGRLAVLAVRVTERVAWRQLLATRLRQHSAVGLLGQHAVRAGDLQHLLERAARLVADTLDVPLTGVFAREPGGQELTLRAGHGWPQGLIGQERLPLAPYSPENLALVADRVVAIEDVRSDPRLREPGRLVEHGAVSGLTVAIPGTPDAYGVLGVYTTAPRHFTPDDALFLESVATILAQAVERERILRQLQEREERFRLLIEASADLIGIAGLDGRIHFMSASAERLLGYRPDEMIGRSGFDFLHPDERARAAATLAELVQTPGVMRQITLRFVHRDGSIRILEASGVNLPVPAVAGIVFSCRDVTERHALEEQLSRSQRLESVGRLAGGIAHDFNNILTVILGNAELLSSTLPVAAREHEELDEIKRGALRARDLVQQLLAFARKQVLAPRVLDLNAAVRDLERLLRRLLREDILLRLRLAEGLRPVVADPGQLEQVLINLAVNARDAMPTGGTLTIETAGVTLDDFYARTHPGTVEPGPYVMVAVSDTGVGMTPEVLANVFEPFFTTKPYGAGTGLGLATTYGIVKQSGGHIYAYSEAGVGSTFKIYLPCATGPVDDAVDQADAAVEGGTETLLLVEDDDAVRSVAQRVLERAGYRVLTAITPEAALALEAGYAGPIRLLVTDVVMSGMSGHDVAAELSRRRPGLKVLYMSGYTENAVLHHGVVEPGTWFLPKPFTGAMLAAKVREVLDAQ